MEQRSRETTPPLDSPRIRTYVRQMTAGNLTQERLESIERGAQERHTLMNRVVLELVEEVIRLRGIIAGMEEQ